LKTRLFTRLLLAIAVMAVLSRSANGQLVADSVTPSSPAVSVSQAAFLPQVTYVRPTQKMRLRGYLFDAFGPYPIVGAALAAGINQGENTPPEWKQGAEAYGKRFGSDFGIAGITTTTRYALASAFREDTLYYRCQCKGVLPRLSHAIISTFSARRGDNGHRVFSMAALVAPYAGTMTAVYGWYPDRYSAKDALRMGNYSLLGYVGGNIALEFLYGGPHSLLSRIHLNNPHAAPAFPDPTKR
jgi:hypothetical protein